MRLEDLTETEQPISGARGGLLDLDSWVESTGGWIQWLGSGAIAVGVIGWVLSKFGAGAGGLIGTVGTFFHNLLGGKPAAAPATQSPASSGFYV